ncbi:MAG: hypothetical protein MK207_13665 [Saprospiraceae bacterium]|nr:hypothetical protein [Saprospiraceae bacterium]
MILYGLLGIIVLVVITAVFTTKDANKKAISARLRLKTMEIKYDAYINKNIHNTTLTDNDLQIDISQLASDALMIIRPELDSLIRLINSNTYSVVNIDYPSQFFPNLIELIEAYFRQGQKKVSKRLTEVEEQNLRNTALDAMYTDIQKRLLGLDIGDL